MITAGALAAASVTAVPLLAEASATDPQTVGRQKAFEQASAEYDVPLPVLLGVAYHESAWEAHPGEHSTGGGYGPMHLTDVTPEIMAGGDSGAAGRGDLKETAADSSLHTLRTAAKLTGLPTKKLRENVVAQIQYETSAELVAYLADRFGIPLDRQHIIGHDNVPGPNSSLVSGMHGDQGPSWDWERYMRLLHAPDSGAHGVVPTGSAVTITPGFDRNQQTVQVCPSDDPTGATPECTERHQSSNFLYLRTAPSRTAPLLGDQAIHADGVGTNRVNDWGSTVQAGQQFVVAGCRGDWTAIWYSGTKVWFHNPHGRNTSPARGVTVDKAAGTSPAALYGSSYPDKDEYPAGLSPSTQAPLSFYTVPAGRAYVATSKAAATDDYFSSSGTVVTGGKKMYTIQYNHRIGLEYESDVVTAR